MSNDLVRRVDPIPCGAPSPHPLGHPTGYSPRPVVHPPSGPRVRGPWDAKAPPARRSLLRDLAAFLRLLRAVAAGRYARLPVRSMLLLAGAAIYVVSPIDAIPDFIPFVGAIDDVAVIALVLRALRKDVAPFVDWESLHA